jgi:hypothetical protein
MAEASSTDAGASALATETPGFFGCLLRLGFRFGAPVGDQLVGKTPARSQMGEHASHPLSGFPTSLNFRARGFRHVCHSAIVPSALASLM